jgi:hypothetical protein
VSTQRRPVHRLIALQAGPREMPPAVPTARRVSDQALVGPKPMPLRAVCRRLRDVLASRGCDQLANLWWSGACPVVGHGWQMISGR